jgi:hypothetical protein
MLDQMIHLIYWYGSKSDGDFYGFVSKSNYFTYEQESAKGKFNTSIVSLCNNVYLQPV